MTGLLRTQRARLIGQHRQEGRARARAGKPRGFARRFTEADIAPLARVDAAHGWLSGPATRRILTREHEVYCRAGFERFGRLTALKKHSRTADVLPGPPKGRRLIFCEK